MSLSSLIRKGGLRTVATATFATPATLGAGLGGTVATVATVAVANPVTADAVVIRDHLLVLAESEYRDPVLVRALSESFLRDLHGMGDDALRALLAMLADDADRRALRRPRNDTGAMLCRSCGPVWIHPSIAAVLPVVDGWPRALGCPWCLIHPKGGMDIPRPPVTCADCQHYQPDSVNPAQGCGSCVIGIHQRGGGYPFRQRQCKAFQPKELRHES